MDTHVRNRVTVGRLAGPAGEGDALRFLGAMIEEQRRPEEGKNKRILCCPGCAPWNLPIFTGQYKEKISSSMTQEPREERVLIKSFDKTKVRK
jgi:hypothetical protein